MTISDLKRRAVVLRLLGLRPKEISKILKSGHSAWVVGKWLRESEAIPSTEERVIEEYESRSASEVAEIVGVTERRVHQILQTHLGPRRKRNTPKQNAELFLSDPQLHMNARFTQSVPFGRALLRKCVEYVSLNPVQSLRKAVEPTLEIFARNFKTRRSEAAKRSALCLYIQGQGIDAHVYMAINRLSDSHRKLVKAQNEMAGCVACESDQYRRLGLLFVPWKKWGDAWSALSRAMSGYSSLVGYGHDLHCNGMASPRSSAHRTGILEN